MSTNLDTLRSMLSTAKSDQEANKARLAQYREDYRVDPWEDTAAQIKRMETRLWSGEIRINALEYAVNTVASVEDAPDSDDGYTTAPEFFRIHDEGDGWAIDGATHGGRYTEFVWKFDKLEEAAERVPAFIRHIKREGYTVAE